MKQHITKRDALLYETHSSLWCRYISNPYLQKLAGRYYAWKVNRKYKRYDASMIINNRLFSSITSNNHE